MNIDEDRYGIIYEAENELGTSYMMNINDDDFRGFMDEEEVLQLIEDLTEEIKNLKEKLEEQQEEFDDKINDFYKPKSPYEVYGISEDIFH